MRITRRLAAVCAPLLALPLLAGCGGSAWPHDHTLRVVVGFYPIEFAARAVGGSQVTVVNLTKPGVEPHDLELTPLQVAMITDADVIAYIPGFAPALDEAIAQNNPHAALDVTKGITLLSASGDGAQPCSAGSSCPFVADPHVWLDPLNEGQIGQNIAIRLASLRGADTGYFDGRKTSLWEQMQILNGQYTSDLKVCATRTIVTSHAAFGYLAKAYKFTQVGISGLNPDAEPSPARLAEVAAIARKHNVTTIYSERLVSPAVAQTLATAIGVESAVLDPLEGEPPSGTYITQMQVNLATLKTGQGCS